MFQLKKRFQEMMLSSLFNLMPVIMFALFLAMAIITIFKQLSEPKEKRSWTATIISLVVTIAVLLALSPFYSSAEEQPEKQTTIIETWDKTEGFLFVTKRFYGKTVEGKTVSFHEPLYVGDKIVIYYSNFPEAFAKWIVKEKVDNNA